MTDCKAANPPVKARASGLWDYVSPSRLNTWLKCPLAFRLRYVDGIRTPPQPAAFIGKVVHRGLERFYRHRQLGVDVPAPEMLELLAQSWEPMAAEEGVQFKSADAERAARSQSVQLLNVYLSQLPMNEPRPAAVEVTLEAPLIDQTSGESLGIPLLGVVDLVLPEPVGLLVADFKTTSRGSEPLEILHEVQLSSYAYLLRAAVGREEAGLEIRSLVKTKVPRVEAHRYAPRNPVHFRRLFAVIRAYLDDLDAGQFLIRPGWACTACEFRHNHCGRWQG